MPRPRITEPEIPRFKEAIASFNGCTLDKVHRKLLERINQCISRERIPIDEACDAISRIVNASRDDVREKLAAHQPHSEADMFSPKRRSEAWPATKSLYRTGLSK